jgi:hypothetical protein
LVAGAEISQASLLRRSFIKENADALSFTSLTLRPKRLFLLCKKSQNQILANNTKKKRLPNGNRFFLVAQVQLHWNQICQEILNWKQLMGVLTPSHGSPARY